MDFRLRKEEKDLSDVGRRRIDDTARRNYSKRAYNGSLTVIRDNFLCKCCGSKKALRNTLYTKCTKCGKRTDSILDIDKKKAE
jgi:Zn finger protein HypA/HybF involved in hydrogenase expression